MPDTKSSLDVAPSAWPPRPTLTPVELNRFSRPVIVVGVVGTLAIVGALAVGAWILHRDLDAILHALRTE